ncbi:MAG: PEP-CTERM sorting domain-containing protein [Planctomycetaceae bacterium]
MRPSTTAVVVGLLFATARGAQAGLTLAYSVNETSASGRPYPTAPVTFDVFAQNATIPPDPIHGLAVSLFAVSPREPDITLLASDNGAPGAPGRLGTIAALPGDPPDDGFPSSSLFDWIVAVMGIDPQPFLPGSPRLGGVGESAFDVLFDLQTDGFIASHAMRFAIGDGQPLEFRNVAVGVPQSPSFHLTFELVRTGDAPLDAPLFSAQLQGTAAAVPEPASIFLFALSGAALFFARRRDA